MGPRRGWGDLLALCLLLIMSSPVSTAVTGTVSDKSTASSTVIPPEYHDIISSKVSSSGVQETVLVAKDPETEARELYDHALKQWGGAAAFDNLGGASTNSGTTVSKCTGFQNHHCQCSTGQLQLTFSCRNAGLTDVPADLSLEVEKLDLTNNNITRIGPRVFEKYIHLEELILSGNHLEQIDLEAFSGLNKLKKLVLHECGLTEIPGQALHPLKTLTSLQLEGNFIEHMEAESVQTLEHLRILRLDGNLFTSIPTEALKVLPSLEALNLGSNRLTSLPEGVFPAMENLVILLLRRNKINAIDNSSLANLTALRVLELDDNLLTEFPSALAELAQLQELSVSGNKVKWLSKGSLPKGLSLLELRSNPLSKIEPETFLHMSRLRKLVLSEARGLVTIPPMDGATALEVLRVDRGSVRDVPDSLCKTCPRLKSLDLKSNRLLAVPDLTACRDMRVLDLAGNSITTIEGRPFRGLGQLHDLLLAHNNIAALQRDAFHGLPRLQVLDLEGNKIEQIHPEAFVGFSQLEDLNLGNNMFPTLPPVGLHRLLHLKTFNNPKLREFPPPEAFPRIQSLVLSYAYHCCAFLPLVPVGPPPKASMQETWIFPVQDIDVDMTIWNNSQSNLWPHLHNLSKKFGSEVTGLWDNFGPDITYPGNWPAYVDEYYQEDNGKMPPSESPLGKIQCLPLPGPFLPCQDLFDWWSLRCGVWVVFLLSMLGNGTVVFVLMFSRSKMDVPRFLVCNLAAADFFMGVYLGFLAVVDASTLGEFRMFAIPWQMSIGCQLSGFLAVLSSELSVYTLAVITLERNYAITHAMHLNKRLSLKHAGYIMAIGWVFAVSMAILPLFGISDYRKFAICLPFETNSPGSLAYVVFLMFINGVAFLILMGCYLKMYCAIRGSQAWNSNDSRIAKRMALLVFTDFLCWSPIAFFSLTAAFGLQLISLEEAKIFTVFVLPLNSCCNPFLYAILTKQFKKDCVLICKAIEESRVTRGIGRCRHSSNFSNRQTPANTNSLVERSSRDMPPLGAHTCGCSAKLLCEPEAQTQRPQSTGLFTKARRLLCSARNTDFRRTRSDQYAYQIAEIQQKQHKRAGSLSSDNFSSSRSDSWRHTGAHNCGIPLRLLDPRKRASSWIVTRKTSQDSNLSSSRNDSSGSATTASTSTWRVSRSSAGSSTPLPPPLSHVSHIPHPPTAQEISQAGRIKPRLTRQAAVHDDAVDSLSSPRLAVRFLATIPSAAESSVQLDEEGTFEPAGAPFYAVLHSGSAQSTLYGGPSNKVSTSPTDKRST